MAEFYGNLHNRLMESSKQINPEVGMGCTLTSYSDRHAATIIKVEHARITVQMDKAIRTDTNGMSDCQSYRYERDPDGQQIVFRLGQKGQRWRESYLNKTGRFVFVEGGKGLLIGHRDHYHDYCF